MAGPIPTKKIPQLTALGAALQGVEQLEIWVANTSRRVTSRDFVLPEIDPLITAVDFTSVLTMSRYLTQGPGVQFTDNGPGQSFEIAISGTGALPADPTAMVGLTVVPGSAPTWMRSDAAPPIDQGIRPVWTDMHTFSRVFTAQNPALLIMGPNPMQQWYEDDAAANNRRWRHYPQGEQLRYELANDADTSATLFMAVDRTNNTCDSIAFTATAMTWNALAMVNVGSSPTWTGAHIFTALVAANVGPIHLQSANPGILFNETDAAASNRLWDLVASTEQLQIRTKSDDGVTAVRAFTVDRTGTVVDDVGFYSRTSNIRTDFTIAGAAQALDLRAGNDFHLTLQNNPTLSFTNPPAAGRAYTFTIFLLQDGTGNRTVTWPASVHWSDGLTPVLTTTANRLDAVSLTTLDGGTTYYGGQVLANMVP